jgi:5-hydroxyisourate hydrolase
VSAISTHVLDTAAGRPAAGMRVRLERVAAAGQPVGSAGETIAAASTDASGRIASLGPEVIVPGIYRLVFDTGGYLARQRAGRDSAAASTGDAPFFPEVVVTFTVAEGEHYHVPLLMSPYGYSTYRGS